MLLFTWTPKSESYFHPHERGRCGAVIWRCCTSALEGSDRKLPCPPARFAACSSQTLKVNLASCKTPRCHAVPRDETLRYFFTVWKDVHLPAERTAKKPEDAIRSCHHELGSIIMERPTLHRLRLLRLWQWLAVASSLRWPRVPPSESQTAREETLTAGRWSAGSESNRLSRVVTDDRQVVSLGDSR